MAALTLDADAVSAVQISNVSLHTTIASVDITAGQVIRPDDTTGKWVLAAGDTVANAGARRWVALKTVKAGQSLTGMRGGLLDLGRSALEGLNFNEIVYLSDTPGAMSDVAFDSTTETVLGSVQRGGSAVQADKLLLVDW